MPTVKEQYMRQNKAIVYRDILYMDRRYSCSSRLRKEFEKGSSSASTAGISIPETTMFIHQSLGKIQGTLQTAQQKMAQHAGVIHLKFHRRGVGNNLDVFTTLHKTLDRLHA